MGTAPSLSQHGAERNPFAYPPRVAQTLILQKRAAERGNPPGTPDGSSQPATVFILNGILWTDRGGVASINQKIFREGESLEGYKIVKIERQKVILKKEGEEIRLHLAQSPLEVKTHDPQPLSKKKR
jgi:type II secretory pathway component PulC